MDKSSNSGDYSELIARLASRVENLMAEGCTQRAAIRAVARETEIHPMEVKRLVVLYPEA